MQLAMLQATIMTKDIQLARRIHKERSQVAEQCSAVQCSWVAMEPLHTC